MSNSEAVEVQLDYIDGAPSAVVSVKYRTLQVVTAASLGEEEVDEEGRTYIDKGSVPALALACSRNGKDSGLWGTNGCLRGSAGILIRKEQITY